jgi:hypothetical protein
MASDLDEYRAALLAAMEPYETRPLGYLLVQNTVEMLGQAAPSQSYPAPEVAEVVRTFMDRLPRLTLALEAGRMASMLVHPNGLDQVRTQVEAAVPPPEPPPEGGEGSQPEIDNPRLLALLPLLALRPDPVW